jgi:prepilin-type N-terminal cleavage/methylation domain-containing protein
MKAKRGYTLVELAISMFIISLIGLALTQMLVGVSYSQINSTVQGACENIASNLVDRLRFDLRFANQVDVVNAGTTLEIFSGASPNPIRYRFAANTVTRTDEMGRSSNLVRSMYDDPNHPIQVNCMDNPCFQPVMSPIPGAPPVQMRLSRVMIRDNAVRSGAFDNAFNITDANGVNFARPQFRIEAVTFNLLNGQQFQ